MRNQYFRNWLETVYFAEIPSTPAGSGNEAPFWLRSVIATFQLRRFLLRRNYVLKISSLSLPFFIATFNLLQCVEAQAQ